MMCCHFALNPGGGIYKAENVVFSPGTCDKVLLELDMSFQSVSHRSLLGARGFHTFLCGYYATQST